MNDKIYVLVAFGGEYDDAWEHNVAASFDLPKLEALQSDKESTIREANEWYEKYYQFREDWGVKNPPPDFGPAPKEEKWPPFTGLKEREITAEMRAERQRIKDRNAANRAKWTEPLAAYHNTCYEALAKFCAESGRTTDDTPRNRDVSYRIEQIEFV